MRCNVEFELKKKLTTVWRSNIWARKMMKSSSMYSMPNWH